MNPARLFRKSVAALNDWFEKAEKEEIEQRMEVVRPAIEQRPSKERIGRDLDGSKVIDFRQADPQAAGIAEVVGSTQKSLTPVPEDDNHTPAPLASAGIPPTRIREEFNNPAPDEIVFAPRNDRVFRERNRTVREIGERYSRFGDSVASAVLQKCLVEDGVQLLATKLGLTPEGVDEADHQQIVRFIEENGVPRFCEIVGVRGAGRDSEKPPSPSSPINKVKMAQNISGQGKKSEGESHKMKMPQDVAKPVSLSPDVHPRDKAGQMANPSSRKPAPPAEKSAKPFPFAHRDPSMTPPPEGFQEPRHEERPTSKAHEDKDRPISHFDARVGSDAPPNVPSEAAKSLQRVKAAPLPLPKSIAKQQPANPPSPDAKPLAETKPLSPPTEQQKAKSQRVERRPADYLRDITEEED